MLICSSHGRVLVRLWIYVKGTYSLKALTLTLPTPLTRCSLRLKFKTRSVSLSCQSLKYAKNMHHLFSFKKNQCHKLSHKIVYAIYTFLVLLGLDFRLKLESTTFFILPLVHIPTSIPAVV